jgi:predicted lipoprotein with Yx(FWY)xxD motif
VSTASEIGHAIVTDDRGLTLYRFTRDQDSTGTCYDWCARAWPPVLVDGVPVTDDPTLAQSLGTTVRTDGSLQLTFDSAPLYYYVGDGQPGDTNGQGSAGLWFVVDAPSR